MGQEVAALRRNSAPEDLFSAEFDNGEQLYTFSTSLSTEVCEKLKLSEREFLEDGYCCEFVKDHTEMTYIEWDFLKVGNENWAVSLQSKAADGINFMQELSSKLSRMRGEKVMDAMILIFEPEEEFTTEMLEKIQQVTGVKLNVIGKKEKYRWRAIKVPLEEDHKAVIAQLYHSLIQAKLKI